MVKKSVCQVEAVWDAERAAYHARYSEQVIEHIAQRAGAPATRLQITNDVLENYPLTGLVLWRVKLLDVETGRPYHFALGSDGVELDPAALQRAEVIAYRARYGKLNPELYYRLQAMGPEEPAPVLLWLRGVDYDWVDAQLAARYPALAAEFRFAGGQALQANGSPAQLEPALFEQVYADYNDLLDQAHLSAAQPVVDFLQARGYQAKPLKLFPGVHVELPASAVLALNESPPANLDVIYWGEIAFQPALDSAAPTIRAPQVWRSNYCDGGGCTGAGVTIAIAEGGIVHPDITHGALQGKILAANLVEPTSWHAAAVAGVIAGDHPAFSQYRGIAYGNSLISAKILNGSTEYMANGLNWIIDQEAFAINASFSTTSTARMQSVDRLFDYIVRLRDPTIVVAAGALSNAPRNVKSPAKAYNVITVGAFDDHNNADWSDDSMLASSCYVDPYIDGRTVPGDREKPEVVAVGANVMTVDIHRHDSFTNTMGTSFAAPQVTALAALLMEHYYHLRTNPQAVKAIIMASAINNIEGDQRLSDQDGAGGIDIAAAFSVFEDGGWAYHNIPNILDFDDPANPFEGLDTWRDFQAGDGFWDIGETWANDGERVRAVLAWDSNPISDYEVEGGDVLSTDFDLFIVAPSGAIAAQSRSYNNNYEIVDFVASETGEYKMRVHLFSADGEGPHLGIGLAWVRVQPYDAVYLEHNTPHTMAPGSWTPPLTVTVRNSGVITWTAGNMFLGYRWYPVGSPPPATLTTPCASPLPAALAPGDSVSLSPVLWSPNDPGLYHLRWDMTIAPCSSPTWFQDLGDHPLEILVCVDCDAIYLPAVIAP